MVVNPLMQAENEQRLRLIEERKKGIKYLNELAERIEEDNKKKELEKEKAEEE